jgi:TolA-binding protein
LLLAPTLVVACAGGPGGRTLADLHDVEPDVTEVRVENSLDRAIVGYREFLEAAPESTLTPEAMRRLADLKVEKEFGIIGDGEIAELPAPEGTAAAAEVRATSPRRPRAAGIADHSESERDFELRAGGEAESALASEGLALELPGGEKAPSTGPLEAIELYDQILATYPTYRHNDQVLYQKARAYDELGRIDEAIAVIERLIAEYPTSRHIDEVQFRRAEYFFTRRNYRAAEEAYSAITEIGPGSEFYELALYKLGWTFYKQELHEEALHEYVTLLDYKVSTGYDFDQSQDEGDERRIADTYRVLSLSFSNLGGPEAVEAYFAANGHRGYEDRIYSHLGEFYLEKLRYHDAAAAYRAFVALHPLHRASPHFSMRVVEIYEAGDFPKLVLESKKDFAATYGLESEYWHHFGVDESPEVLSYLKANLEDLAKHYHALYQEAELAEEKPANFQEALRWYRAYLTSFPEDPQAPAVNYRLADLLLEHEEFGAAAREYERTAYDYPEHERAAAAGYAAIFAHREHQKLVVGTKAREVRREAVASTLRFVDTFPEHEHAAAVLGAAADDLYGLREFDRAIATAEKLIDRYPEAALPLRRSAWAVIAHSSFDTAAYPRAERAYARVLEMTAADDDSRQAVVDNLAASIYKQGEEANRAEDHRSAAEHFLRIAQVAPTSEIRALAEYDAGAALIHLEEWSQAAAVFDAFRQVYPEHELRREATKQMAFVYREEGNLSGAAREYETVAAEAEEPDVRREALLVAGDLYENSGLMDRALAVYLRYVSEFPEPIETAVETRFKIAEMCEAQRDEEAYRQQLRRIVEIDEAAGEKRTARVRYLAARSALALSEVFYHRFDEIELVQPFERNLQEKNRRMDAALDAFASLVDYEVGEVTAAATFYMAEVYAGFSRALMDSERPDNLDPNEMQDYEMVLEGEAFPFEERAIEVHQKNLELMAAGVYNQWIEKSHSKLAELVPGRVAKFESSSGWIKSIDTYAYRLPSARGPAAEEVPTPEDTPAPAEAVEETPVEEAVPANVGAADETESVGAMESSGPGPPEGSDPEGMGDGREPKSPVAGEVSHAGIR